MKFYMDGCDAEINLKEFLAAAFLGTAVVYVPLLVKLIARAIL